MKRSGICLALLLGTAACDPASLITDDVRDGDGGTRRLPDGGTSARSDGATQTSGPGADLGHAGDLATGPSCATVSCGAHAHCDATSIACVCDSGFGGDPRAGCEPQTACGACPTASHCDSTTNTCACDPGYVLQGGACAVASLEDPATRSQAAVCAAWASGHVVEDGDPWTAGATQCDPGALSRTGINDTVRRINLYRWLSGLYPVVDDAAHDTQDQSCAVMEAANGTLNHMPPMSWTCWTQAGYDGSSSSNLAEGGGGPSYAIDLFMDDGGVPSLGHRRWVMNPPLDNVGVGFANSFTCLGVFDGGNTSPPTQWQAVPNPGPVPIDVARFGMWTFHSDSLDLSQATATIVRKDDGTSLPVTVVQLPYGYGVSAIGLDISQWAPEAGKTYTVTIGGLSAGAISYDVQPVTCQ